MKVGTRNNILFGIIWKLSGPSSMIGSNLENLEEHFLGVLMRAGATSPQFWMPLIFIFTIFLSIILITSCNWQNQPLFPCPFFIKETRSALKKCWLKLLLGLGQWKKRNGTIYLYILGQWIFSWWSHESHWLKLVTTH